LNIAIAKSHEKIAPCFETAGHFQISVFDNGKEISSMTIHCSTGCEGFGRIRVLREYKIDTLICKGIKEFYLDMLEASGLTVISHVTLPAEEALKQYLAGTLKPEKRQNEITSGLCKIPHEDLVCWTKELFESHGYIVSRVTDQYHFPIDLVAEILCPVCFKPLRVAICCGAHIYRTNKEIREFHHKSQTKYHAHVYVHPSSPEVQQRCQEYGIELIDPNAEYLNVDQLPSGKIPILQGPVFNHERASKVGMKT